MTFLSSLHRCIGLLCLTLLFVRPLWAQEQSEETAAILSVAQQFFDALATQDTLAMAATLLPEGQILSVREVDGKPVVKATPHQAFPKQLAALTQRWLERMWDPQVMIHGRIAMLWTNYDFYRDGNFSHCGVDAFTFFKTEEGWKIAATTYTVEPTGCPESPLGPPKQ